MMQRIDMRRVSPMLAAALAWLLWPAQAHAHAQAFPCNGGGGGALIGNWSNSSMAIIRDRGGDFFKAWVGQGGAERDKLLAECTAKQLLPCEVFATVKSSTNRRLPGASTRKCETNAWSGNGFIQAYQLSDGGGGATAETSAERAKQAAQINCRKQNSKSCGLVALFDSRKPGLFVHDFRKGGPQ